MEGQHTFGSPLLSTLQPGKVHAGLAVDHFLSTCQVQTCRAEDSPYAGEVRCLEDHQTHIKQRNPEIHKSE